MKKGIMKGKRGRELRTGERTRKRRKEKEEWGQRGERRSMLALWFHYV